MAEVAEFQLGKAECGPPILFLSSVLATLWDE